MITIVRSPFLYRVLVGSEPAYGGDDIYQAVDIFNGALAGEMSINTGTHDVTDEPLIEARRMNGRLVAVLYGVTSQEYWDRTEKDDGPRD